MKDVAGTQFENIGGNTKFPFSSESSLVSTGGAVLPVDFAIDASIYSTGVSARLDSIYPTEEDGVLGLSVFAQDELKGLFTSSSECVYLTDERGVRRGIIVFGDGLRVVANDSSVRKFNNLKFDSLCVLTVNVDAVTSITVGEETVSGHVELVDDRSGKVSVVAVTDENSDGSSNLRFDVLSNSGISSLGSTGIRVIHVLRKPGSLFNVIEKNGNPYIYLTKTGSLSQNALIDRASICAGATNKNSGIDYVEKSEHDDCRNTQGSSSQYNPDDEEDGYCYPNDVNSSDDMLSFVRKHDTLKLAGDIAEEYGIKGSRREFGYYYSAEDNGYVRSSTMALMFIESELRVTFSAYSYGVLAYITEAVSDDARALFEDFFDGVGHKENFSVILKPGDYKDFYSFFKANSHGKLGYVDKEYVVKLCKYRGWYAGDSRVPFPPGIDELEFTYKLKAEISSSGFGSSKYMYTNRARDFFSHFNCKNWVVSSADSIGDDARMLVGWGPMDAESYFDDSSSFSYSTFFNTSTRKTVTVPKWIAARELWWRKYSVKDGIVRHFIVPRERGLTIYTGDYYADFDSLDQDTPRYKEVSPLSWSCGIHPLGICGDEYTREIVDYWRKAEVLATMKNRLFKEYPTDFSFVDNDTDDIVFNVYNYSAGSVEQIGIPIATVEQTVRGYDNRVNRSTNVVQPSCAPILIEEPYDTCKSGNMWLGPFEYMYEKMHYPCGGSVDSEVGEAAAVHAPSVFKFAIDKASSNSLTFDTSDMTADGVSYQNPIHIKASDSVSTPPKLDIVDPTDQTEVSDKTADLISGHTTGNGIEISITGM